MVYLGLPTKNGDFPWLCSITKLCIYIESTRFLVETTCRRLLRQSPGRTRRMWPAATAMRRGMWPWWQLRRGLDLRGQELNGFPGNSTDLGVDFPPYIIIYLILFRCLGVSKHTSLCTVLYMYRNYRCLIYFLYSGKHWGYPTMGPWGNNHGNLHLETWILHGVLCLFFRGVLEIPWDHHESVSAMAVCKAFISVLSGYRWWGIQ